MTIPFPKLEPPVTLNKTIYLCFSGKLGEPGWGVGQASNEVNVFADLLVSDGRWKVLCKS